MITEIPGIRVGHWTDADAATGCTVALFPEGTVASGEVRGGAPASREMDVLDPSRAVQRIDAIVLTGGSAFGLAAADGVMRYCEEWGMGVPTPAGPVPIVVALALFDLAVGDSRVRPNAAAGYAACEAATSGPVELGAVGAGTGATVGGGTAVRAGAAAPGAADPPPSGGGTTGPAPRPARRRGGLVGAAASVGDLRVATLVAVNAHGAPGSDDATATQPAGGPPMWASTGRTGTTIGVVATNADIDKLGCLLVAQGAHDGLARSVFPVHTRFDGDAFVAVSVGGVEADVDVVRGLAVHVVARAVGSLAP